MEINGANLEVIETMLETWADWARSGSRYGTEYPSVSVIGAITETGGHRTQTPWPKQIDSNETAEIMESWVVELGKAKPMESKVLKEYYVKRWHKDKISRVYKVSVRMLEHRIKSAKDFLLGCYAVYGKLKNIS
jgi:hypothetical protein